MKVDIQKAPVGTIVYSLVSIDWKTTFDNLDVSTFAYVVVADAAGYRRTVPLAGVLLGEEHDFYSTIEEAIHAAIAEEQSTIEQVNSLIQRLNKFKERVTNSPPSFPVPPPFEPNRSSNA